MVKNRRLVKLVVIIIVLLAGTLCRFFFTDIPTISGKYFDKPLPDKFGHWEALEIYTCPACMEILHNEVFEKKMEHDTATSFFFAAEEPRVKNGKCPFHNIDIRDSRTTALPISPAVYRALPEDTEYDNRYYFDGDIFKNRDSHSIQVSIVTSGKDKRSIHRAERCLQAQGNQMKRRKTLWLDLPETNKKKLDVTVIHLQRVGQERGVERTMAMYFYAGNKRITADNFKRLGYMAWDRMIIGQNYRWSYILMISRVNKSYKDTEKAMVQFISELFPIVEK